MRCHPTSSVDASAGTRARGRRRTGRAACQRDRADRDRSRNRANVRSTFSLQPATWWISPATAAYSPADLASASSRRSHPTYCRACCHNCRPPIRSFAWRCAKPRPKICSTNSFIGDLDAVMLAMPVDGVDIETQPLFDDAFLLGRSGERPICRQTGASPSADIDQRRLTLLEEGHCLRDQALAYCAAVERGLAGQARRHFPCNRDADGGERVRCDAVAGGGSDVEVRDRRVKQVRFAGREPARTIGLAWRRTSPRERDFAALGKSLSRLWVSGRRKLLSRNISAASARVAGQRDVTLRCRARQRAERVAANERSIWLSRFPTTASSRLSWRSAASLTMTARNVASSGAASVASGKARSRDEVGDRQPATLPAACAR